MVPWYLAGAIGTDPYLETAYLVLIPLWDGFTPLSQPKNSKLLFVVGLLWCYKDQRVSRAYPKTIWAPINRCGTCLTLRHTGDSMYLFRLHFDVPVLSTSFCKNDISMKNVREKNTTF